MANDADAPCGFLVLDKPTGITSHGCVSQVRRAYGLKRVGHGGTLDPAVTGVLPIAVGPATRLLPYLDGAKRYRGTVQLGLSTSSDDLSGTPLASLPVPALSAAELNEQLELFRGTIQQRPPQVSAVHVDGERAYSRVRRGEQLELQPRSVTIQRLELVGWDAERAQLQLEVHCSAGTYIRALARDLGEQLGCGGCLAELRRTAALGFQESLAVPLSRLEQAPPPALLNPLEALRHLPRHALESTELASWRCGQIQQSRGEAGTAPPPDSPVVVVGPDGKLAGMAVALEAGQLQPRLVLQASG